MFLSDSVSQRLRCVIFAVHYFLLFKHKFERDLGETIMDNYHANSVTNCLTTQNCILYTV